MDIEKKSKVVGIVDDDESVRDALQGLMKVAGYPALVYASAEEFLSSSERQSIACLITDMRMPGMSGLELQAKLKTERRRIPIVFITAHGDEEMRIEALRAGAVEFLMKPVDKNALLASIRAALDS
jgi:FixJ family two-component response regulator